MTDSEAFENNQLFENETPSEYCYGEQAPAEEDAEKYPSGGFEEPKREQNSYNYGFAVPETPVKAKKKKGTGKIVALVLSFSILSAALGTAGTWFVLNRNSKKAASEDESTEISRQVKEASKQRNEQKETSDKEIEDEANPSKAVVYEGTHEKTEIKKVPVRTDEQMSPAEVYVNCVESSVGIRTQIVTNYWGYTATSPASGSGFIYTENGYVITNYHVVEGASEITVMTYDDKSYPAELIGYDENNDVAVLKIEAEGLKPVITGNSDAAVVGEQVVAIGNPLGELTFSLTSGYVSALDREVTLSGNLTMNLIQTDCAINSGNSGGPLFNLYGEVIGITNAKMSSSSSGSTASIDNIGFAIPLNTVRPIIESIIEKGYYAKPYIGITVSNVSEDAQRFGSPAGAAVYSVIEDSPAEEAGLAVNDIIVEINGESITGSSDLVKYVSGCKTGDEMKLKVFRSGKYLELTMVVGETVQTITMPSGEQQTEPYTYDYDFGNGFPFGFGFPFG